VGTTADLTKPQFKELATATFLQSTMKPLPNDRDVEAAFYLADEDKNGKPKAKSQKKNALTCTKICTSQRRMGEKTSLLLLLFL
jgi:hypothetical protein